ncbi:hypothetical protein FBR05_06355 [Deltaproteobacteria bacterium PRO3]|nr:hypothetical protein [Deltaproteobacteria bacterium PRO3]
MSTQRIPAPFATALLAAEGGDFQSLRAAASQLPQAVSSADSGFETARPRLVGEIRSTRAGIWGGNDGKALLQNFKNGKDSSAPAGKLDNGESGQEEVDGFEGRFRFSVPQPQPRPKLDI